MEKKGKPLLEFQAPKWMQDLSFMVNITEHLNNLNKTLQGRKKVVTQCYDSICAFNLKLTLWETPRAALMHGLTWAEAQGPPEFRGLPCSG